MPYGSTLRRENATSESQATDAMMNLDAAGTISIRRFHKTRTKAKQRHARHTCIVAAQSANSESANTNYRIIATVIQ